MNLNDLAKRITLEEGGKKEISIAQVKEVLKLTLIELAEMDTIELLQLLRRYE